ncbi:MAG: hypothetical protein ACRDRE_04970 [Pseudonocardiaceae bacterium]
MGVGASERRAVGEQLAEQIGEGLRGWCGWVTDPQQDGAVLEDDVVGGEQGDSAEGLGVEQHEQADNSFPQRDFGALEEFADHR